MKTDEPSPFATMLTTKGKAERVIPILKPGLVRNHRVPGWEDGPLGDLGDDGGEDGIRQVGGEGVHEESRG